MKKNDFASEYLNEYEDSDVVITAVDNCNEGIVAFNLSDGTHWFADENDNYQVSKSLIHQTIRWDENHEDYVRIGENGHKYSIPYMA